MKNLIPVLTIVALTSVSSARAQSTFRDVPDNHWAAQAVKRLAEAGIIEGRPESLSRTNKIAVAPAKKTAKVASKLAKTTRVAASKTMKSAGR